MRISRKSRPCETGNLEGPRHRPRRWPASYAGPVLTELAGTAPADCSGAWSRRPTPRSGSVGTGPEGRVYEITLDPAKSTYTSREFAKLDDSQVVRALPVEDRAPWLAARPPRRTLLPADGKVIARMTLPATRIFDILPLDDKKRAGRDRQVPAASTGLDLAKFGDHRPHHRQGHRTSSSWPTAASRSLARSAIATFAGSRDSRRPRTWRAPRPRGNLYVFPREAARR